MSSQIGKNLRISLFGESHASAIGVVIEGLKPGIKLDFEFINQQMKRRSCNQSKFTTKRKEDDEVEILSGYFNNKTTGSPLAVIIKNKDVKSKDYEDLYRVFRPSHADFPAFIKFNGFNDYRGGGHFSARITAPIMFVGAIAMQILKEKGIKIESHILQIGNIRAKSFLETNDIKWDKLDPYFKTQEDKKNLMKLEIENAIKNDDSVGGIIETVIFNLPTGVGEPFFDSIESQLSKYVFSIPGVKGIEFGLGFDFGKKLGSNVNDQMEFENDQINFVTNNNGGILGGLSTGEPIIFKSVLKPTPSIGKSQKTINSNMQNKEIKIKGRHDPCIVIRAVAIFEAMTAICILDMI